MSESPKVIIEKLSEQDFHKYKAEQKAAVLKLVKEQATIPAQVAEAEVEYFYEKLGVDEYYFLSQPQREVARHVQSLYAAKILAKTAGSEQNIILKNEAKDSAMFAVRACCKTNCCGEIENYLETTYLNKPMRVQVYRTSGPLSADVDSHLRFYFLNTPIFTEDKVPETESDVAKMGDIYFNKKTSDATKKLFSECMKKATSRLAPVMTIADTDSKVAGEKRVVICYKQSYTTSFFQALTQLYMSHGICCSKKFVEPFANGYNIICLYTVDAKNEAKTYDARLNQFIEEAGLLFVLPKTAFTPLFLNKTLTIQEACFAFACWKFSYQFLNRYREEYESLRRAIEKADPASMKYLLALKAHLRKDTFTEARVLEALLKFPALIKSIYAAFEARHKPGVAKPCADLPDMSALKAEVDKTVVLEIDASVFEAVLNFSKHIVKTNFYIPTRIAFSYRLMGGFLSKVEYPDTPFSVIFFCSQFFRGFHVRFRDIARGGLRLIRSVNLQAFIHNTGSLFDENYNLAHTQQRKNKDIPEGGSKGTLLIDIEHQDKGLEVFRSYIDSLLDVMLSEAPMVNHYGKQDVIFCGPDENTADYMEWAAFYAGSRGYKYWKAFTTGKPRHMGGVPHDMYGMTTRSVHQCALGMLREAGVDESTITKFQTGGPDGDLGSNEILISKDRTIAIVDGSGVVHDPEGLNREETTRLAKARKMVEHFDPKKLSKKGFKVLCSDKNVTLPDGTVVASGLQFRNIFHTLKYSSADLFVPCGGRPESITINNIASCYDEKGKPRWKWISEGANLFITQAARLQLEKDGVWLIKDATANKGGVTSSSYEVLAAMAMTPEEHEKLMCVKDDKHVPEFFQKYVDADIIKIEKNAAAEFNAIYQEWKKTGTPMTLLSDMFSNKINAVRDSLRDSPLYNKVDLRNKVLKHCFPQVLIDTLGFDTIVSRLPENYLRAHFSTKLADDYVYKYGLNQPEYIFYEFLTNYN